MKKIITLALLLVMLSTLVNAGSIQGLDFDDCTKFREDCLDWECTNYWHHICWKWTCLESETYCSEDIPTEVNDGDVDIDADTVSGLSSTILSRDGGWRRGTAIEFLYTEFVDFLRTIFVPRSEYNELQDRLWGIQVASELSATEVDLIAAQHRAQRTGEIVYFNDYTCYPNGIECQHN